MKIKRGLKFFLDRISFFISVLSQTFLSKNCNSHDPLQFERVRNCPFSYFIYLNNICGPKGVEMIGRRVFVYQL